MHLMVLMKRAGVNVKSAGDSEPLTLKDSSHINMRTLGRLGFKKDFQHWNYLGRGHVKSHSSHMPKRVDEEESHRRSFKEEGADHHFEEAAEESAAPDQSAAPPSSPRPRDHSTSTFPSTPHLARQISNLQTSISNQIAHLTSHISEKLDFLTATFNSRLDSMDSKLEDLSLRVKSCETLLQSPQPPPPKPKPRHAPKPKPCHTPQPTSTPTPPPKSILKPPSQPTKNQPSQPPQDPSPIPIPDSPPPTVHPSQTPIPSSQTPIPSSQTSTPSSQSGSPLFSMEELLSSSFLQPQSIIHPPQPSPQPSDSSLAIQLVRDTLQIPKIARTKKTATKTYHRHPPK